MPPGSFGSASLFLLILPAEQNCSPGHKDQSQNSYNQQLIDVKHGLTVDVAVA